MAVTHKTVSVSSLNKIKTWKKAFVQKANFAKYQVGLKPCNSTKSCQFHFMNQVSVTHEVVSYIHFINVF